MFTSKDLEFRTIYVLNCVDENRTLRVQYGELLLEEEQENGKTKTLTKMPFQKILALFVIGHITVTTPLLEKCQKYNVSLVVMKTTLRPVFFWANSAEANYLLRKKQHTFDPNNLDVAKKLVENKIHNQITLLQKTRKKDELTQKAIEECEFCLIHLPNLQELNRVMGCEGYASKHFFSAYFQNTEWKGRKPRTKCDYINATLDIGYTILFNFIECFIHMYGFDPYVGVLHRLWFKRKSLVCDLMEPFRCIIDHIVLLGINRKQIKESDFKCIKGEYKLKIEKNKDYNKLFYSELIERKTEIFNYIQGYYRQFMSGKYNIKEYKFE